MKEKTAISFQDIYPLLENFIIPQKKTTQVSLEKATELVLAQNIYSPFNVPSFNNSAMDGWAYSSKDILSEGFTLKEVGSSFAGHPYTGSLNLGECVRIMTGAMLPDEADTVTKQEIITAEGTSIHFPEKVRPNENVRFKGEEFLSGDLVLEAGTLLRSGHISLLASLGIETLTVYKKIRVAFFSTGDELQTFGKPLKAGHIYDSNRYSLQSMLQECGIEFIDLGILCDNADSLKKTLLEIAPKVDAIITSGGVSVGQADLTRLVVNEIGTIQPWYCKIRPGKPLAFGKIGNTYFFGLPGNPTASQVTFHMIVRFALNLLMGITKPYIPITLARVKSPIRKKAGVTEFQRGRLFFENGSVVVDASGTQKTSALSSMATSNCFILLPEQTQEVESGELVSVLPFYGVCS